ncbi:histidinol-phosphate transaminase [Actinomyces sp. B33]|uniref:histidinol-phosphate transaminase n=1 Tax=Actinomyces sp. B33 TaxID=2942131 RepID=UPI002340B93D|nr:histidinol-phosphate transaminase [Actinomyces sp. B33]MDC4233096.1 histidinol-phosphate transaminase [Actinomyces sp. B33]
MTRLPVRADLAGLEPYGAPQLDVPVRLNVNENPYAPSPDVVDDIARSVARAAAGLNRYPDRDFSELRAALADYLAAESGVRLDPALIWAANGSNEVMTQILQAFGGPGRTVVSFAPTYSMYHEYARDTSTRWVQGSRRADHCLDLEEVERILRAERPSVVLLASPNNPTGTSLPVEDQRRVLDLAAGTGPLVDGGPSASLVVVDEAYGEFRRDGVPSALELLADHPHLVVSRTMSKAFGMAGLRLGYMACDRRIIDAVMLVRLPYHLSAVTQAAALAALRHRDELMAQVAGLRAERDGLVDWLRSKGFDALDSDANFVLFGRFDDRDAVFRALLDRGVLIRVVGPDGWLRVSVGTPEETRAFTTALEEITA